MIALLLADRCTSCGDCVSVCPADVFEQVADAPPVIARQADCQTCFMCELYCREDALFVDPDCETARSVDSDAVRQSGRLGEFRRLSGWDEWRDGNPDLHWRMETVFQRARDHAAARPEPARTKPE